MYAQFINYEELYPPTPQYIRTAANPVLDSSSLQDDFESSEYQLSKQPQQESWLQWIRRKLTHKRSNRQQKVREMAIAKFSADPPRDSTSMYAPSIQESRWQRFKRFFSRQRPNLRQPTEKTADEDAFAFTQESFTDNTEDPNNSFQETSTENATDTSDAFTNDSDSSTVFNTESPSDQDWFDNYFSSLSPTSRQQKPIWSPDNFTQTLITYAQQLSSGEHNAIDIPLVLVDLYRYNLLHLKNHWYAQMIENIFSNWVSQVASIGRKIFHRCLRSYSLTQDFMNFLNSIDYFLADAVKIDTFRKSQKFQDLIAIVNVRFIDWFKILLQTPGIDQNRFLRTINDFQDTCQSPQMRKLMARVIELTYTL